MIAEISSTGQEMRRRRAETARRTLETIQFALELRQTIRETVPIAHEMDRGALQVVRSGLERSRRAQEISRA